MATADTAMSAAAHSFNGPVAEHTEEEPTSTPREAADGDEDLDAAEGADFAREASRDADESVGVGADRRSETDEEPQVDVNVPGLDGQSTTSLPPAVGTSSPLEPALASTFETDGHPNSDDTSDSGADPRPGRARTRAPSQRTPRSLPEAHTANARSRAQAQRTTPPVFAPRRVPPTAPRTSAVHASQGTAKVPGERHRKQPAPAPPSQPAARALRAPREAKDAAASSSRAPDKKIVPLRPTQRVGHSFAKSRSAHSALRQPPAIDPQPTPTATPSAGKLSGAESRGATDDAPGPPSAPLFHDAPADGAHAVPPSVRGTGNGSHDAVPYCAKFNEVAIAPFFDLEVYAALHIKLKQAAADTADTMNASVLRTDNDLLLVISETRKKKKGKTALSGSLDALANVVLGKLRMNSILHSEPATKVRMLLPHNGFGETLDSLELAVSALRIYRAAAHRAGLVVALSRMMEARVYAFLHEWMHDHVPAYGEGAWKGAREGSLREGFPFADIARALYARAVDRSSPWKEAFGTAYCAAFPLAAPFTPPDCTASKHRIAVLKADFCLLMGETLDRGLLLPRLGCERDTLVCLASAADCLHGALHSFGFALHPQWQKVLEHPALLFVGREDRVPAAATALLRGGGKDTTAAVRACLARCYESAEACRTGDTSIAHDIQTVATLADEVAAQLTKQHRLTAPATPAAPALPTSSKWEYSLQLKHVPSVRSAYLSGDLAVLALFAHAAAAPDASGSGGLANLAAMFANRNPLRPGSGPLHRVADHFNAVPWRREQLQLFRSIVGTNGAYLLSPVGLSFFLLFALTGQCSLTAAFARRVGLPKTAGDVTAVVEEWSKKPRAERDKHPASNGGLFGTFNVHICLGPTQDPSSRPKGEWLKGAEERVKRLFQPDVSHEWAAFHGPDAASANLFDEKRTPRRTWRDARDLLNRLGTKKQTSAGSRDASDPINGLGKTGIVVVHLLHLMAAMRLIRPATVDDMADFVADNLDLGAATTLSAIGFDLKAVNGTHRKFRARMAFRLVHAYLTSALSVEEKAVLKWDEHGPSITENLLCKGARVSSTLSVLLREDVDEAAGLDGAVDGSKRSSQEQQRRWRASPGAMRLRAWAADAIGEGPFRFDLRKAQEIIDDLTREQACLPST